IDMWMQVIADNEVMISDWPFNAGSTQDNICDMTAAAMAAEGYTVHRVPARSLSGVHYTYTNVVMCNDLVLVPSYTHSSIISGNHNAQALAAWQAALPGKTIVQINCQGIVSAAGVMHCIVMHLPANLGGENPTAYVRSLNNGEELDPGDPVTIRWSTDDDEGVSNVDILLSRDGGATYPMVIASATADDGVFNWIAPDLYTTEARIRVVARDAEGNTGFDDSEGFFSILGALPGDLNGDGLVNAADLGILLGSWGPCPGCPADLTGDGQVNAADLGTLLGGWSN
ncbi:MAG: agmatine deiminase family protein, partial [Planctomycetota bacterium]|nr:agmatine deiminase family protein [Planctomycetota bacterium]